ncbi:MAG: Regulator of RpoS [Anaerolineae bacterium]|nr:Regulator of RpoS [Anaerolineae bacterium]
MDTKRILVVDDDPDMLFLVAHGIKSLGPNYQVSTAASASAALEQVNKQRFDLIVTDYMMPEMTGLDLVPQVRQISPQTQFVMITAHHDTNRIRDVVGNLNIGGFVGKPFILPELLEVIQEVASQTEPSTSPDEPQLLSRDKIVELLDDLRRQTGARNVLLINTAGAAAHVSGANDPDKMGQLAAFVSSNFQAMADLASLFDEGETSFKSSYFEGNRYNIYAYNLNGSFFLGVVFGADVKPGSVWFYTKQVVGTLSKLLPAPGEIPPSRPNRDTLAKDFDDLLGNGRSNGI